MSIFKTPDRATNPTATIIQSESKPSKNAKPLISVVMSVYNGERYLREAIDSILSQTHENLELIIIDDSSTDGTADIIKSYSDERIRDVRNLQNLGLTKSLNKGIALVLGEYIARQDADDRSTVDRFEKQLSYLERHPHVAAVGCFTRILNSEGIQVFEQARRLTSDGIRHFLKGDTALVHGSLLMRKSALDHIGGYDEEIHKAQDYDLLLRMSEQYDLANLQEFLYEWRDTKDNISSNHLDEQLHFVKLAQKKARGRYLERRRGGVEGEIMDSPDMSILMANYNNRQYISHAIESVLGQTCSNWELVIVDDASTDNSTEIIREYLNDPRIHLLENDRNRGYIWSLNRLISSARSETLGILDSGDALTYDAVDTIVAAHRHYPDAPFIYTQFLFCTKTLRTDKVGFGGPVSDGSCVLRDDCAGHFSTFKKSAALQVNGFDEGMRFAGDKDFIYKMEELGSIIYIDEALYFHRVLPESLFNRRKRLISRTTRSTAMLSAYKRRVLTFIPNLSEREIVEEICFGLGLSVRTLQIDRIITFTRAALEFRPFGLVPIKRLIRGIVGWSDYPKSRRTGK